MLAVCIGLCFAFSLISVGAFFVVASGGFTGFSLVNDFNLSRNVPPEDISPPEVTVECFEEDCSPPPTVLIEDGCFGHRCGITDTPR